MDNMAEVEKEVCWRLGDCCKKDIKQSKSEYISNETLAVKLEENDSLTGENAFKTDINDVAVLIEIKKVAD